MTRDEREAMRQIHDPMTTTSPWRLVRAYNALPLLLDALDAAELKVAAWAPIMAALGEWFREAEGSDEEDAAMLNVERLYNALPKEARP